MSRSSSIMKFLLNRNECAHKAVNFRGSIIHAKTYSHRGIQRKTLVQNLRAVVPRANGDSLSIKQGRDIVRMNAFQSEAENRSSRLRRCGTEKRETGNIFERAERVRGQFVLLFPVSLQSDSLYKRNRRSQADYLGNGGRAALKFLRQGRVGRLRLRNLFYHVPPDYVGRQFLQPCFFTV